MKQGLHGAPLLLPRSDVDGRVDGAGDDPTTSIKGQDGAQKLARPLFVGGYILEFIAEGRQNSFGVEAGLFRLARLSRCW